MLYGCGNSEETNHSEQYVTYEEHELQNSIFES